jgi:general secretion pathway protein C
MLLGTVATESPTHGIAIISADGAAKIYKVGDEVNGASLHSVYLDRVILNRSGNFETLALPLLASGERPLPKSVDDAAQPVEPRNLRDLGEVISAKACIDDESEKLRGFTIQPTKVRRAFYDFGLRPRDLVTAVNGTMVVDQDRSHSQEIVDAMLRSGQAIITIVRRNGEPQDIALDIAQLGMSPPIVDREVLKY